MALERPPRRRDTTARLVRRTGIRTTRSPSLVGRYPDHRPSEHPLHTVQRVLSAGGPMMVFQPQLCLQRMTVSGYEALARFPGESPAPGPWFALARQFGLGQRLEAAALVNAFEAAAHRPAGTTVAVNVSPGSLHHPAVRAALPADLTGFEIELTEQAAGLEAGPLRGLLEPLRQRGARLAIDDVGTAYSGLRRVVELAPDTLKIDRQLVTGVSRNGAKAALIRAVVDFAGEIDAGVCAEGVEDLADLATLAELGVGHAQGWVVGPAEPHFTPARAEAVAAGARSRSQALVGRLGEGDGAASPDTGRPAGQTMEELVCRLAGCPDAAALTGCVAQIAAVLGCERCELSWGGDASGSVELQPSGRLLVPVDDDGRAAGLLVCVMSGGDAWSGRQIRTARLIGAVIASVRGRLEPTALAPATG